MRRLLCALCPLLLLALSQGLLAHGGQYRGPTNGSPPGTPGTPGGLRGPVTGGPVQGGPLTGGEADLDLTSWRVWWELNQGRYVAVGRSRTVPDAVRTAKVVPALVQALQRTDNPDVSSAALVALGKTGTTELDVFRKGLRRGHLEVREAAVLGLALSGQDAALADLHALLAATKPARQMVGKDRVDDRMRTFAAYGLGLFANRSDDADVKEQALTGLLAALEDRSIKDRDLRTAVLNGIRLIAPDLAVGARHKRVLWQATGKLNRYLGLRMSGKDAGIQSHGLTALGALVGRGDDAEAARARKLVVQRLAAPNQEDAVYASATVALGRMLRPGDKKEVELLVRRLRRPPHPMMFRFGLIALGEIGGDTSYEELRRVFSKGSANDKAWAALGLGLLAHGAADAAPQSSARVLRDKIGALLLQGLRSNRTRDLQAAIAIGLGLSGHTKAVPDLQRLLDKYLQVETFSGHVCVSLALLNDKTSIPRIQKGLAQPDNAILFGHAALALAHLDRPNASGIAVNTLANGERQDPWQLRRLAGAAKAIGHLENPADVDALILMLDELGERRTRGEGLYLRTAFATAALGSVADRDPVGFGTRIADGMNYAARIQTISNGRNGVLDVF